VRRQNSGAVEDFILPYSAVYLGIQKWKNYWNRSTFAKVIVKIKVAPFLMAHGVCFRSPTHKKEWRLTRTNTNENVDNNSHVSWWIFTLLVSMKQEAQLPQRDSASATHVFLGSLTDRALQWVPHLFYYNYRVGQKSKPDNFCNNFVYCQPISVIFGTYTL